MAQRPPGGFGGGGKRDTPTEAIPSPFEPAPPAGSRRPASTLIGSGPSPSASRPAPLPLPPPPPPSPSAPLGPRPGPPGPPQAVPLPGSPFGPLPGATARLGQAAIPVLHDGEAPGDAPTSVLVSPFGTTAGLLSSHGAAGPTRPGLGASPAPLLPVLPVLPAVPPAPTSSPYLLPPQPPQQQLQPQQLQPQPLPEPSPSASGRRPGTTDYGATESLPGPPRDAAEGWLARHLRHFELAVLALLGVALLGASFAGCAASSAAERAAAHTTAGFAKLDEANAEVLASIGVAEPASAAGQSRFAPALAKRREAEASFEQGQKDGQTGAKLASLAAFFAMSLFLGALASALTPARLKLGLFGLGALVALVSLVRLLVLALS